MRAALSLGTPPLPPQPPFSDEDDSSSSSYSLLIITFLLSAVIAVTAAINILIRCLSRPPSPPPSDQDPKPPGVPILSRIYGSLSSSAGAAASSPDCAVCLSAFRRHEELRRLPACRHAFHAPCIDTWLRTSPTCPLCRHPVEGPAAAFQVDEAPPELAGAPAAEEGEWLKDYVDRLASSFRSIRSWSFRSDGERRSSDENRRRSVGDRRSSESGEAGNWGFEVGLSNFDRWLTGV